MSIYDLLLRCYPASFRNEYGEEMRAVFVRRRREAGGFPGRVGLWLETVVDVLGNAAAVHGDLLRQDLAYSARMLRRAPGFAVTAVVIVALGIGATTAAFSVTDFVLIRPLPFPQADRLVKVTERTEDYGRLELSPANYRDWTRASTVFERIGSYYDIGANLASGGEPVRIDRAAVSADLLPTLGVQPLIGRLFTAGDDRAGAAGTTLLSYRLWQTEFGGDAGVLGRQVRLDDEPFTVVGVMPQAFRFPTAETSLWTPQRFTEENYVDRGDNWLLAVGRLRAGTRLEQAQAELDVLAAQSSRQYPKENAHVGAAVRPLRDDVSPQSRLLLLALSGAAVCVLLIACANLANLLLVRALGRRRELAVRTAMGAGRERMVRQLMTESLLLSFVGGAVGILVAFAAVPLLNQLVPAALPIAVAPTVDLRVLLFALALTGLTGVAFGLAPVLRIGGETDLGGLREGSRSGGGRKEGLRSALVIVEIMASVVLLVSAGLLMRAMLTVQSRNPGFRPEGVLTMQTPLPVPKFGTVASRAAFYDRVVSRTRALPGVRGAAFVTSLPLGPMRGGIWPVALDGRQLTRADNQNAFLRFVTPSYFATLGVPLRSGRDVSDADTSTSPFVAVVSESFVRRYWPSETPASVLGHHFTFALSDRIVAGVVGDVRMRGLERASEPQVYLPFAQVADNDLIGYIPRALVVRTSTPPETLAPAIRDVIRHIDPALPVSDVGTLTDVVERDTASRMAQLRVLGAFALIAFILAGIGVHGLLSFTVSQRAQEIGVRVALGAQRRDVLGLILRRSTLLALAGVVPGVALAYAAGRSMEAILAGVKPGDAATVGTSVGLTVVMTLAGSLLPTLRALRVDPIAAIRAE